MQLSYSSLSIFKNCKRCFYLDRVMKIPRPRGIFSSFPGGVDLILKKKMDDYRGLLPPELSENENFKALFPGFKLYAGNDLEKLRNWRTNPYKMTDGAGNVIVGALDDLLYNEETDTYAILDYKTKGSAPTQEYVEKYYQMQIDIYSSFFLSCGKKCADYGVLLYFWPKEGNEVLIDFETAPFFIKSNPEAADIIFRDAVDCLQGPIPQAAYDCEYCAWVLKVGTK